MQEVITILSGILAVIGFYWAFLENNSDTSKHTH